MDDIDRAQDSELEDWEERQRAATEILEVGPSSPDCVDCGEPIPAARRAAVSHCITCIDCQRLRERT